MKYEKNKTNLVQVRLSDEQMQLITLISKNQNITKSDVIRMFINKGGIIYGDKEEIAI